jgi:hypothetical protein
MVEFSKEWKRLVALGGEYRLGTSISGVEDLRGRGSGRSGSVTETTTTRTSKDKCTPNSTGVRHPREARVAVAMIGGKKNEMLIVG